MQMIAIVSSITLLLDQIIKIIVSTKMTLNTSITIIKGFFSITYVRNDGAAFSILGGKTLFLILVSLISLYLIYYFLIKDKKLKKLEKIIYGLLIGGLLGNLLDRILLGCVIDYLSFNILGYEAPIFNLADTCIVVSTCLLILFVGSDKVENKSIRK